MAYYPDFEKIDLKTFGQKLTKVWMPPSRRILKERIDERMETLVKADIHNLKQLITTLKKPDKIKQLAKQECLDLAWLTLLLRELKSMSPKPNLLTDFEEMVPDAPRLLSSAGITNTAKLYDRVTTKAKREKLADETGIDILIIEQLTHLTDVSRIKWAGAKFSMMLCQLHYDTPLKISCANPEQLHRCINALNKEKMYYKGQIGLNDIRVFIDAASDVPADIEY
ncbi:MAG: DUF4332 domain-containing protein [Bacteroidales bacterium]|nr:DUF4332 domain-containing protein [Bacteroidales bacterium]MDD3666112.1 DUF4332 domain-containing protein [Bacteroidales bacterium]